jgi:hypothetical protein
MSMLTTCLRRSGSGRASRQIRWFSPVASISLVGVVACLALGGCSEQSDEETRGGGYVEPAKGEPANEAGTDGGAPGAKSALGKAKERAERLVNEDIAEYNQKIEDAADGKIP